MIDIRHPSEFISKELVDIIRDNAHEAEKLKQLHPLQLKLILEQKWFQLFVPKIYGGLELSLPEALRLEEALAWTDGSVGWTVTLCGGAGWFIGFLEQEIILDVFNGPGVCIAGSGKAAGTAKRVGDGYEITGYWDHATGANYATAFTANCIVEAEGEQVIQPFLFLRDEVTIHQNWNSMGMIATGSHSFEVSRLRVKNNRGFHIGGEYAKLPHPVYQYPFLAFAETTLAVNMSGMAMRFLDLCATLPHLENACEKLEEARHQFYEAAPLLKDISLASRKLASAARHVVNEMYPCCGLRSADPDTEINRIWRNIHTAGQHSLLSGCSDIRP
jgi:alkylation response protein AidB-like acyl-CoA dehydrogenase